MAPAKLSNGDRQQQVKHLRMELSRVKEGKKVLKSEIQEMEAKLAGYSLLQQKQSQQPQQQQRYAQAGPSGTQHLRDRMPGSFAFPSASAPTSSSASDSEGTEVPNAPNATNDTTPALSATKQAILEAIYEALCTSDHTTALRRCIELLAVIHEDLNLHTSYLEASNATQATDLAQAMLALEMAGVEQPVGMRRGGGGGPGAAGYYSETTAEDTATVEGDKDWEDEDGEEEEESSDDAESDESAL